MTKRPLITTLYPYTTLFRSRPMTGEHFIDNDADTEDIRSGIDRRPEQLLRGHVRNSADDYTALRQAIASAHFVRRPDRKSTRLNSSHRCISYAVFCLKKKTI